MTTDRVDLLTVARTMAASLDLPPIGGKDPVYGLTPPGQYAWLDLASRPGLAEALILALAEYLETLPVAFETIYLGQGGVCCEPGFGGHQWHNIGWYDGGPALLDRALRRNDRLLAAPGMSP